MGSQRASQRKIITSPPEEEVNELGSSGEWEEEWEARAILDERTIPNPDYRKPRSSSHSSRAKTSIPPTVIQYLIDWEGLNPETGERWDPSWENGDGATQGLIDDWKRRKIEDPDVVGRYTRKLEEKKRKSRRKSSAKHVDTPDKDKSKRVPSDDAPKADAAVVANAPDSASRRAENDKEKPLDSSLSTAKSTPDERIKRSSQPSKRNIVVSPPMTTQRRSPDEMAVEEGERSSRREARSKASSKGEDQRKSKQRKDATAAEGSVSRLQDREKHLSTASPRSIQSGSSGKRKRTVIESDSDESREFPTITAQTTSSRTESTVRDDDQPRAKKQKLRQKNPDHKGSRKDDKGTRTSGANQSSRSGDGKGGAAESSKTIRAQGDSGKARDFASHVATPETSSIRKKQEQKSVKEPSTGEVKGRAKKSVTFDQSQATNSPSVVGDSQPPLTSSGESRASQQTPSQRTPPDPAHPTDVRRLAISGALTQASLGSPKRPGEGLASPLVNAKAGPSRTVEPPAAEPMDADQEFLPNSLFAMEDDASDHSSPDMPQSQAVALQRAIDLLMMEENFLEEEKAKQSQTPEPQHAEPPVIPEPQPPVEPREEQIDTTSHEIPDRSGGTEKNAKEPSKRVLRKPFAAVDDFVAPAPPTKQVPNAPDPAAAVKPPNVPKELHPIPHIAPSVFRNVGISGTPDSFANTQADLIHDFESPHRAATVADTTAHPSDAGAGLADSEQAVAVDVAVQTEDILEQIIAQVPDPLEGTPATMEEEEESQLPELGEDDWSRILDTATINPSMLGKAPGIVDDEDVTSSEENSARSDANVPARVAEQSDDLLVAQAKIRVLESDLARVQLEKKQLEENVDTLKADLQERTVDQQNTLSQFNLIQDLYNQASATTMRLNRVNEELEDEAEKLKSQVEVGLKQKDLFIQSFMEAKDREIVELKARNELLLQQAVKMDDVRSELARLRTVDNDLRLAQAQMDVCAECNRRMTQASNDSDLEYRSYINVVPANNERSTRSRAKAREETEQAKVVEKPVVPKPPILHAPVQKPESEEARKKLPLTDLARWAHDRDIVTEPDLGQETNLGADVVDVDLVHICRWRPKHGNVCSALFANVDDLANHTLGHLSSDQGVGI